MASFQKYETKQGSKWKFQTRVGIDKKLTTRRGFNTKKEAIAAARRLEEEYQDGAYLNTDNITFQEVYEQWYSNHSKTIKISTQKSIESKFKKHILPRFGRLKIKEITKSFCQEQINEIAKQMKSVNDIKIQANLVFKYALKMDILSKNPIEHVTIPKQQKELINKGNDTDERNYWTKEEIKHFLSITKENLRLRDYTLFHCMIYTGARKGELLALTWEDIDFQNKTIRFTKTLAFHDNTHIVQTSKTKASRRFISIDDKTLAILKKLKIEQNKEILQLKKYFKVENNNVFTRDDGTPMRLAYPNEKLNSLIKTYNFQPITIHGLRHTHASLLFEAGASIKEVQERLGHSDIKMTMNIYTHVTNAVKEQTADKFQRYLDL